jgi:uncharacterized protein (DUF4213/DUF364 family)
MLAVGDRFGYRVDSLQRLCELFEIRAETHRRGEEHLLKRTILDDLLDTLPDDAPVRSVLVGAHWTAVCSRSCGLASTLLEEKPHDHVRIRVRDAGRLHLKSARELAEYARSDNPIEASIGVAALNSLLHPGDREVAEINAAEVLVEQGSRRQVAVVGRFPFIPRLRDATARLWVIEKHPAEGEYPAAAASELIPRAEVVALTGSALINHTLDDLLALCSPGAVVVVLGPSTPLSPVLFDHGVTMISGAQVIDEELALHTISQGGTFQQVRGTRLRTLTRELTSKSSRI